MGQKKEKQGEVPLREEKYKNEIYFSGLPDLAPKTGER